MEMSNSISELAKALCKAQAAMKPVIADNENPYFKSKYADLAAVWENCRKPLTDNGLSVVQTLEHEDNLDNRIVIKTVLLHESGEWISSRLALTPVKNDPQAIGSAITYGRRYSLAAMVGVASENEDDDAESATRQEYHDAQVQQNNHPAKRSAKVEQETPTDKQVKKLGAMVREIGLEKEAMIAIMQERYDKTSSKDLTKTEMSDLIDYLTKVKNGEEAFDLPDFLKE